jgi:hypothetical protein
MRVDGGAIRDINLHWHDLRHEYASRLVEHGVPLAQVLDLFGHASILTTERYDAQRLEARQPAVEGLEGGKTFDPKIEATDNVSASAGARDSARTRRFKNLSRFHQTALRRRQSPRGEIRLNLSQFAI